MNLKATQELGLNDLLNHSSKDFIASFRGLHSIFKQNCKLLATFKFHPEHDCKKVRFQICSKIIFN